MSYFLRTLLVLSNESARRGGKAQSLSGRQIQAPMWSLTYNRHQSDRVGD